MQKNSLRIKQLFFSAFLIAIFDCSVVYGFERGPLFWAPGAPPYDNNAALFSDPYMGACEYWASKRDTQWVGIPSSQLADIKKNVA